jgi:hypothetical protein
MDTEVKEKKRISCPAPAKVWEKCEQGGWSSRDWYPGEKSTYERDVLYR